MISVIATIELAEGRREDFLAAFAQVVPKVLAEDGCVEYGPWSDLETSIEAQPPVRGNVITAVEKWESIEALEAHLIAPHMIDFRKAIEGIVTGITLHILKPE